MALIEFKSQILADVGISMGDEGKGRVVYELIEELKKAEKVISDPSMRKTESLGDRSKPVGIVMKVNGGANSGHTAGGVKLNLLPVGVVDNSVDYLVLGAGVVADPRKVWWEVRPLEALGYKIISRLVFDERTMISDITHRLLDLTWEEYRVRILNEEKRGSTGRGISPAYSDETSQRQILYGDILGGKDAFATQLKKRIHWAEKVIFGMCEGDEGLWNGFFETLTEAELRANADSIEKGIFGADEFDFKRFKSNVPFKLDATTCMDIYWKALEGLMKNVRDIRELILENLNRGKYIIGEFGQSYWLDKRHGFAPNVTASHTYVPEFFQSAGIPIQPIHTVACCKAYDTKVGTHTFLTEMPLNHPLGKKLKKMEFGTSTGRQRMVGWFDAVEKGDALRYGGYDDLVINKLDALSYGEDWPEGGALLICVAYRDESGKLYKGVPRCDVLRKQLKPVYEEYAGWSEDISEVRRYEDLPLNAKRYVAGMLKSILEIANREGHRGIVPNLRYIGVGPMPSQIIKDIPKTESILRIH